MPRIPVYERAVAPQPGQPAELRVASSPEDFGAGLAAGLNAAGAGMNELARKQYELDVAKKVNDAEALYAQGVNAVFYAPGGELRPIPASDFTVQVPGGVAMLRGDAAVNAAPAAADAIKRVRKQIYDSLDGDAASLFYHRTQRDEDQHLTEVGRLATAGALEARKTARDAANAAAIDATLRNPFDDSVSNDGMAKYVANERIAVIDAGGTKEAGDVAAQEAVQKWMRTRANAMAEAGQFAAALDYLKRPDVVAALGTEADALRYKWHDHGVDDVASGIVSKVVESVTRRDAAGKAVGFDSVKGWEQLEDAFDKAGATPEVRAKGKALYGEALAADDARKLYQERADYEEVDGIIKTKGLAAARQTQAWGRLEFKTQHAFIELATPPKEPKEPKEYDPKDVAAVREMMLNPEGLSVPHDLAKFYGLVPNEMFHTAETIIREGNPKEQGGAYDKTFEKIGQFARRWLIGANLYSPTNPTPEDKDRLGHIIEAAVQDYKINGVMDEEHAYKSFERAFSYWAVPNTVFSGKTYKRDMNLTESDRRSARRVSNEEAVQQGLFVVQADPNRNTPYNDYERMAASAKAQGKTIAEAYPEYAATTLGKPLPRPSAPAAAAPSTAAATTTVVPYADVFHGENVDAARIQRELPAVYAHITNKWRERAPNEPLRPDWVVQAYAAGVRNGAYANLPSLSRAAK